MHRDTSSQRRRDLESRVDVVHDAGSSRLAVAASQMAEASVETAIPAPLVTTEALA